MDTMTRAIILAAVLCSATADVITFKDCGSVTGTVNQVEFTPCPSEPCQVKKGDNATLKVELTPKVDSTKYTSVLHGIIGGVPVPFPLQNGLVSGPISINTKITYSNFLMVLPSYPKVSLLAKLEIRDDNDKDLVCFVWPIQIVD
ncbi:NPC intracellular cholesterol transporter 2-like [Ostrea edulis]|uniref:NPC intracellular cholesterol transporter 2-like n=1 Tax=Ostrea edulis TaxID=37623 RepID=UPI0020954FB5|nr:NPC intracellular cholesterol transporter 2-like [Ostrea edulis]